MSNKPHAAPRRDVLSDITQTILTKLEAGTLPWRRPWKDGKRPANAAQPHSAVTGRPYSGLNHLLLGMDSASRSCAGYVTYQQAKAAGGHIKKGAKGIPVVLWKPMSRGAAIAQQATEVDAFGVTDGALYRCTQCPPGEYLTVGEVYRATVAGPQNPRQPRRGSVGMHRETDGAGTYLSAWAKPLVRFERVRAE